MRPEAERTLRSGWLSHFPRAFGTALINEGSLVDFRRGETIYCIGEDHICIYGVISGSVRFTVTMNEQTPRFLHLVGPGAWFGENELALGKSAILEMSAAIDLSLLRLSKTQFDRVQSKHDGTWRAIAALSSMNLALAVGSLDDMMIRNPKQRLCSILLRLSARRNGFQGQPPMDMLPITQADLSSNANLSRSKTAAILRELSDAGAIETSYAGIELSDPRKLEKELTGTDGE